MNPESIKCISDVPFYSARLKVNYALFSSFYCTHVAVCASPEIEIEKGIGYWDGDALATASNGKIDQEWIGKDDERCHKWSGFVIVFLSRYVHFENEEGRDEVENRDDPFPKILVVLIGRCHHESQKRTVAIGVPLIGRVVERGIEINFVVEVGEDVELAFVVIIVLGEGLDDEDPQAEAKNSNE